MTSLFRSLRQDSLLRLFVVTGVLLLPVVVLLAEAYPSEAERVRRTKGPPRMAAMPSQEALVKRVGQAFPAADGLEWRPVFAPDPEPRSGIVRAYDLLARARVAYTLVVFRHDIPCEVCRDLLVAVLYAPDTGTWAEVLLLEPFERKGELVDAAPFVRQFRGKSIQTSFRLGEEVDGISGATRSTLGFINRLHEVAAWLEQRKATEVSSATDSRGPHGR